MNKIVICIFLISLPIVTIASKEYTIDIAGGVGINFYKMDGLNNSLKSMGAEKEQIRNGASVNFRIRLTDTKLVVAGFGLSNNSASTGEFDAMGGTHSIKCPLSTYHAQFMIPLHILKDESGLIRGGIEFGFYRSRSIEKSNFNDPELFPESFEMTVVEIHKGLFFTPMLELETAKQRNFSVIFDVGYRSIKEDNGYNWSGLKFVFNIVYEIKGY